WKMHPFTFRDAKKLFDATRQAAERAVNVTVIVAPPALYLRELAASYRGRRVAFAAQHAHYEPDGPHTGEISMRAYRDARASNVLIGHAERRAMGESNADTRKKVSAALAVGLTPVLCVGEQSRGGGGEHFTFVAAQLSEALLDVSDAKVSKVCIAYEPVWAIGAEKPMEPRQMQEMAIFIRKKLVERHGQGAMHAKVLYGGSVDETNAAAMLAQGDVGGLLAGRVSTDAARVGQLIETLSTL
ncbi:MAG: triose-phosphate isomerase, partial [Candidatus Andersenbacteria bacterium CG10_big_fil_rev_8_21_14_0_10_54_11]